MYKGSYVKQCLSSTPLKEAKRSNRPRLKSKPLKPPTSDASLWSLCQANL